MGLGASKQTGLRSDHKGSRQARQSDAETAVPLPVVTINARKLTGDGTSIEISPSETVHRLKELLAPHFQVSACQLKLTLGVSQLSSVETLVDCGVIADKEIGVIIMPPIPPWAEGVGLSPEHPCLLRDYYAKHGLDMPDEWASDDGVWKAFEDARKSVANSKASLTNWNHDICMRKDGQATSEIHAAPGEKLTIEVCGRIWNKGGDSCIQQLLLVMDKNIVATLSNGVPSRGQNIRSHHVIEAPSDSGTYMLWKKGDLQYGVADARRNCENEMGGRVKSRYPSAFVGWVIVA